MASLANELPPTFPPLPDKEGGLPWSESYYAAHERILSWYSNAYTALRREDPDPLRLNIHKNRLFEESLPLLRAMEAQEEEELPQEWFADAARALSSLIHALDASAEAAKGMYVPPFPLTRCAMLIYSLVIVTLFSRWIQLPRLSKADPVAPSSTLIQTS